MGIIAATCVKNEIDLIEAFVRHTLAHVDRLIVLDNGSTDGTLAVLHALRAEGLGVEVVEDPSPGQYQVRRTTRLMHDAAVHAHADWVLMLDADEFLVAPPGSTLPPPGADATRPILLPWRTYVPHESDDRTEANPVRRLRYRRASEGLQYWKVMVPRALALRPDAQLAPGCHHLYLGDKICESVPAAQLFLAHFPIRSPGQYQGKIAISYLQYQTMADRQAHSGWHYREAFAQLAQDPHGFAAGYREAARRYAAGSKGLDTGVLVADPVEYRGGLLRHTPVLDDETLALRALLAFADGLAARYAVLSASLDEDGKIVLARQAHLVADLHAQLCRQYTQGMDLCLANAEVAQTIHDMGQQNTKLAAALQEQQRNWNLCRQQWEAERQQWQAQREQLRLAQEQQRRLADELRAARRSWTWQVGRLVIGPLSLLRRLASTLAAT